MSLWEFLTNHRHYWGIPHQCEDRVIMICYGCGKVHEVKAEITPRDDSPNGDKLPELDRGKFKHTANPASSAVLPAIYLVVSVLAYQFFSQKL